MQQHFDYSLEEVIEFVANQREYQENLLHVHSNDDDPSSQRKNEVRSRIVIPKFKAVETFLREQLSSGGDRYTQPIANPSETGLDSNIDDMDGDHVDAVNPDDWTREQLLEAIHDPSKTPTRLRDELSNREKNRTCILDLFNKVDAPLSLDEILKGLMMVYSVSIKRATLRTYVRNVTDEGALTRVSPGVYALACA